MKLKTEEFHRLRDFMYNRFGIDLKEKRLLVESRLQNVLTQKGYTTFTDFLDHLEKDKTGEDLSLVVTKMTTNFTYFYREEQHFEYLHNHVLPEIVPRIRDGNLSIWSAGCSSGEEPYTIAMLLDDYFQSGKHGLDTRILATDISDRVLGIAAKGQYNEERMTRMPQHWKKKYFQQVSPGQFVVKPQIKNEVIFRKFNLMEPTFNFKRKFHVIFCRNVMIYFDDPTREALVKRFYDALAPGGYLFIGLSETLFHNDENFEYVRSSTYRKRR